MEFVPLIIVASLIKKAVDVLKFVTNKEWNAALTQVVTWVVGVLLIWLVATSDFGAGIIVNGIALGDLNAAALVLTGLAVTSAASVGVDALKAFDGSQSAATPALIPPRAAPKAE